MDADADVRDNADIRSTSTRSEKDVDFLIFADADIYFQHLRMQMLKIMRISGPPLQEMDRMLTS